MSLNKETNRLIRPKVISNRKVINPDWVDTIVRVVISPAKVVTSSVKAVTSLAISSVRAVTSLAISNPVISSPRPTASKRPMPRVTT